MGVRQKMEQTMRTINKVGAVIVLAAVTHSGMGASDSDIDRLTTYAVILGRAVACGAKIEEPMRLVGQWMDRIFPPGSRDQQIYLPIFTEGVVYHAQQQSEGKSPDSCSAVLNTFRSFPWP